MKYVTLYSYLVNYTNVHYYHNKKKFQHKKRKYHHTMTSVRLKRQSMTITHMKAVYAFHNLSVHVLKGTISEQN